MNKTRLKQTVNTLLLSGCMMGVTSAFTACASGNLETNGGAVEKTKLTEVETSVAYFDYFTYKGEDDFYKENPLPGPDYFYNPILPGWYSDPSFCKNDKGDYFLVTSSFCYYPGVPIFHSRDLVNWKQIGHILNRPSQLVNLDGQHISGGIFAPDITFNPYNQTYYMITTNVGVGNFFVKTTDPFAGEWSDPVRLPEVGGIDPSFFFDEDGKAYILNNDEPHVPVRYEGHRAIIVQEFDVEKEITVGPRVMLVDGGIHPEENPIWIEGPHMYKIDGHYYVMCAEGGTSHQHSEVILRGDSPMGKFTPWDKNPILTQRHLGNDRPDPITCVGHADLVQTDEGDWWAVFLACRPLIDGNGYENLGRETYLMPVEWSEDGYPYMTQGDEVVPMIVRKPGTNREEDVTFGNFEWIDSFNATVLGDEWMTLRAPATELYSLTRQAGFLSLIPSEVKVTEKKTPAYVARRMQHHKFESATRLYFNPADEKEAAGVLLFKDETHHYFMAIRKSDTGRKITLEQVNGNGGNETLHEADTNIQDGEAVCLKVISEGTHYNFYYAKDGADWQLLCSDIPAYPLSTANAGGFTGTTLGVYAVK